MQLLPGRTCLASTSPPTTPRPTPRPASASVIFFRCRGWLLEHRLVPLPEEVAVAINAVAALRLSTPNYSTWSALSKSWPLGARAIPARRRLDPLQPSDLYSTISVSQSTPSDPTTRR